MEEVEKGNNWINQPRNSKGQFVSNGNIKNNETIQNKRIQLANKAPLLKNVPLLKFTRNNWKSVITTAMNNLSHTLKNYNIICKCLDKRVVDCNKTHIYIKNGKLRPIKDIKNHACFIPYIIPVLQNGMTDIAQNRKLKDGTITSEVVCRTDVKTKNGIERAGISVIVAHNKNNLTLKTISVFRIKDDNKLIKSCPPQAQRGLSDLHGTLLQDSINKCACKSLQKGKDSDNFLACPIADTETASITVYSLTNSTKKSIIGGNKMKVQDNITDLEFFITNINELNKEEKFRKFEGFLNSVMKTKSVEKSRCKLGREVKEKEYFDFQKSMNEKLSKKTKQYNDIEIKLYDLDLSDTERIEKAIRKMSFALDVPMKATKGEIFYYKAQEDLTNKHYEYFSKVMNNLYDMVTHYFSLPKKTVMLKSDVLTHNGKIIYSPETGEPIPIKHWNHFVKTLEAFLNKNLKDSEKRIILDSHTLGKLLNKLSKTNTLKNIQKMKLEDIKYKGKTFDWISDSVKNMKNIFNEDLTRNEQARIQIMEQSAGMKIAKVSDVIKNDVKQILIDGVKQKKSRSQVSQDLFDKMVGHNRDFQRIADTEIQNAFNNANVREIVQNTQAGKSTYLKRIEVIDDNTCEYCKKMNGAIVKWVDSPLENEKIKDPIAKFALWEGKEWNGKGHSVAIGCFHPYCRGTWVEYEA